MFRESEVRIVELEWTCVGSMPSNILCEVGQKDDLNIEYMVEDKEWGGIYEGVSEIYGE